MANAFSFVLDSFQITDTRSRHEDTDYVSFTLVVNPRNGKGTPHTLTKSMGDLNNGTFEVGLSFPNIPVNPTDSVTLNYLIVNSGHKSPSDVVSILESAGASLLTAGGEAAGEALSSLLPIPDLGPGLGSFATWLGGKIIGIINANCDGPVAAEQDTFAYADLLAKTANGPFFQSTRHPGTNSPTGCGGNSVYIVNWYMLEAGNPANKTVPDVFEASAATAAKLVQAAGLVAKFTGQNQTHSWVSSQSPVAGKIVDKGSTVTMVLHAGPLP